MFRMDFSKLLILGLIGLFIVFLPAIKRMIDSFINGVVFPLVAACIIAAVIVAIFWLRDQISIKSSDGSIKPKKAVTAHKIKTDPSEYNCLESQIISQKYNQYCDYFNVTQPFDVKIDFYENKIKKRNLTQSKSERIKEKINQIKNDREEAITAANISPPDLFVPSITNDSILDDYLSIKHYISESQIGNPKTTFAKEYIISLNKIFEPSYSITISGEKGCAILLPEYMVLKEYNTRKPFKCFPYFISDFEVYFTENEEYNPFIHSRRKGPIRTVWKYMTKDGKKDQRYKDNPSTSFIDLSDLLFYVKCEFETINCRGPFKYYRDGLVFEQKWKSFVSKNESFLSENSNLLGTLPRQEASSTDKHPVIVLESIAVPESSPYFRSIQRSPVISQIDELNRNNTSN